jgi:hypothetical protein
VRRRGRVDANQAVIVDALRGLGYLVQSLASVGSGVPDLLVCTPRGTLVMVEVKDSRQPPSGRKLTPDEQRWHQQWSRAPVLVVTSVADTLDQLDRLFPPG